MNNENEKTPELSAADSGNAAKKPELPKKPANKEADFSNHPDLPSADSLKKDAAPQQKENGSIQKKKSVFTIGKAEPAAGDGLFSKKTAKVNGDSADGNHRKWSRILSSPVFPAVLAGLLIVLLIMLFGKNGEISAKAAENQQLEEQIATLQSDNDKLSEEKEDLEKQIDELLNGPSRQLEKVQAAFNDKDWKKTVELAGTLHDEYPGNPEDAKAQELKKKAQAEIDAAEKKKKEEEARKKAEEEARKAEEARKKAEEEARGYETGLTYEDLARYPDEHYGEKVKFYGRVLQVMNSGSEYQIRLAITDNYDTVVLAYYDSSMVKGKILEDDEITIYGVSRGDYTYEAVMGNEITVPLIKIDKIDQ